jgi:hypothetical protein
MIVTDEVISQVDIFPTIAAILGRELPATTAPDGESFLNVGSTKRRSTRPMACPATCGLCSLESRSRNPERRSTARCEAWRTQVELTQTTQPRRADLHSGLWWVPPHPGLV